MWHKSTKEQTLPKQEETPEDFNPRVSPWCALTVTERIAWMSLMMTLPTTQILEGMSFQGFKWRSWGVQQLTCWKGRHGCTSAIQMEGKSPSKCWMDCFFVVNLKFTMLITYTLHSEFTFLSLGKYYLFPLLIRIIIKWAWPHAHILNIRVKFRHWHWVMVLTSNICCRRLHWQR